MPPQHGKSELVSRRLPAYMLGKNPDTKVVVASYSAYLAGRFNRDCQRIINSPEYMDVFPDTTLNRSIQFNPSNDYLKNTNIFEIVGHTGFYKAVGVGGALTGTPADVMIIDDPVKDNVEAMSPVYQQRNWNWYTDVVETRLHNDSQVLITQTRWHAEDLSGKLIAKMADEDGEVFEILKLEAIKETDTHPDDPREIGDALWPDKHSKEKTLKVKRKSLRTYTSLYQQDPRPVETGGEFYKKFRIPKHVKRRIPSLDKPLTYDPDLPLHITFDFNVNPYMTLLVHQAIDKIVWQIDEICLSSPHNSTPSICRAFKHKYDLHIAGLFVYGDPTGYHEDTRSEEGHNDYLIIEDELKKFHPEIRVAKKAPSVVMRGQFLNAVFEENQGSIELYFSPRCINTIADYSYLKEAPDGTKHKQKFTDPETTIRSERYGHTSDANDYFYCEYFIDEFMEFEHGGTTTDDWTIEGHERENKMF